MEQDDTFLVENSVFSTPQEKIDFIERRNAIGNYFILTTLNFIAFHAFEDLPSKIKQYANDMSDTDYDKIQDDDVDVVVAVKLFSDAGGFITNDTRRKFLKILKEIKAKPSYSITTDELRDLVSECKWEIVKPSKGPKRVVDKLLDGSYTAMDLVADLHYNRLGPRVKPFLQEMMPLFRSMSKIVKKYKEDKHAAAKAALQASQANQGAAPQTTPAAPQSPSVGTSQATPSTPTTSVPSKPPAATQTVVQPTATTVQAQPKSASDGIDLDAILSNADHPQFNDLSTFLMSNVDQEVAAAHASLVKAKVNGISDPSVWTMDRATLYGRNVHKSNYATDTLSKLLDNAMRQHDIDKLQDFVEWWSKVNDSKGRTYTKGRKDGANFELALVVELGSFLIDLWQINKPNPKPVANAKRKFIDVMKNDPSTDPLPVEGFHKIIEFYFGDPATKDQATETLKSVYNVYSGKRKPLYIKVTGEDLARVIAAKDPDHSFLRTALGENEQIVAYGEPSAYTDRVILDLVVGDMAEQAETAITGLSLPDALDIYILFLKIFGEKKFVDLIRQAWRDKNAAPPAIGAATGVTSTTPVSGANANPANTTTSPAINPQTPIPTGSNGMPLDSLYDLLNENKYTALDNIEQTLFIAAGQYLLGTPDLKKHAQHLIESQGYHVADMRLFTDKEVFQVASTYLSVVSRSPISSMEFMAFDLLFKGLKKESEELKKLADETRTVSDADRGRQIADRARQIIIDTVEANAIQYTGDSSIKGFAADLLTDFATVTLVRLLKRTAMLTIKEVAEGWVRGDTNITPDHKDQLTKYFASKDEVNLPFYSIKPPTVSEAEDAAAILGEYFMSTNSEIIMEQLKAETLKALRNGLLGSYKPSSMFDLDEIKPVERSYFLRYIFKNGYKFFDRLMEMVIKGKRHRGLVDITTRWDTPEFPYSSHDASEVMDTIEYFILRDGVPIAELESVDFQAYSLFILNSFADGVPEIQGKNPLTHVFQDVADDFRAIEKYRAIWVEFVAGRTFDVSEHKHTMYDALVQILQSGYYEYFTANDRVPGTIPYMLMQLSSPDYFQALDTATANRSTDYTDAPLINLVKDILDNRKSPLSVQHDNPSYKQIIRIINRQYKNNVAAFMDDLINLPIEKHMIGFFVITFNSLVIEGLRDRSIDSIGRIWKNNMRRLYRRLFDKREYQAIMHSQLYLLTLIGKSYPSHYMNVFRLDEFFSANQMERIFSELVNFMAGGSDARKSMSREKLGEILTNSSNNIKMRWLWKNDPYSGTRPVAIGEILNEYPSLITIDVLEALSTVEKGIGRQNYDRNDPSIAAMQRFAIPERVDMFTEDQLVNVDNHIRQLFGLRMSPEEAKKRGHFGWDKAVVDSLTNEEILNLFSSANSSKIHGSLLNYGQIHDYAKHERLVKFIDEATTGTIEPYDQALGAAYEMLRYAGRSFDPKAMSQLIDNNRMVRVYFEAKSPDDEGHYTKMQSVLSKTPLDPDAVQMYFKVMDIQNSTLSRKLPPLSAYVVDNLMEAGLLDDFYKKSPKKWKTEITTRKRSISIIKQLYDDDTAIIKPAVRQLEGGRENPYAINSERSIKTLLTYNRLNFTDVKKGLAPQNVREVEVTPEDRAKLMKSFRSSRHWNDNHYKGKMGVIVERVLEVDMKHEDFTKYAEKYGEIRTPLFHGTSENAAAMISRYGYTILKEDSSATTGRMLTGKTFIKRKK